MILRATFDTTATDLSLRARSLAAVNTPVLSAGAAKFGAKGLATSTGGYAYAVDAADAWLAKDFCMGAWVFNTAALPNGHIVFGDSDATIYVDMNDNGGLGTYVRAVAWAGGWSNLVEVNTRMIDPDFYLADGVKYHLAFNRKGDRFNLFIDGILRGTALAPVAAMVLASTVTRTIGCGPDGSAALQGGIDDVRITLADSVYGNVAFTAPTQAQPTSA
ncbi:Concanavalin A-like lectin/glucanases superfamily [uncultured Caudovirales phage]|uniref:Concanavalin A-like lectin/glucanases superfamily n=1 Tax=uncultured Caudovirales phage TaxID=2100421 RepID=A0A6J5MXN0_9CAUD|nr:Concanavalin A-like lectin/glucanases superfamily [uncultured Caudovirales phage]